MITIHSRSVEETQELGRKLARELYAGANIFFFGDMGSGKTHCIQSFLQGIGIEEDISSPTYAFMNVYEKEDFQCVHIDAYRLEHEDIGLDDYFLDEHSTILVEWSENLEVLPPVRTEVRFKKVSETERTITIDFIGYTLNETDLQKLIKYYKIPKHVQDHTNAVTHAASKICEHLSSQGYILNCELIRQSALLHDLVRYVDFKGGLDRSKFDYEVDNKTWEFWEVMREKYNNRHHADVANIILEKKGYHWLGKLIVAHKSSAIFNGLQNTSEKIVHYADKRAKHEILVPLDERLEDLRIRYGEKDPENNYWEKLQKKCLQLEEELGTKDLQFDQTDFRGSSK